MSIEKKPVHCLIYFLLLHYSWQKPSRCWIGSELHCMQSIFLNKNCFDRKPIFINFQNDLSISIEHLKGHYYSDRGWSHHDTLTHKQDARIIFFILIILHPFLSLSLSPGSEIANKYSTSNLSQSIVTNWRMRITNIGQKYHSFRCEQYTILSLIFWT